MYDRWFCTKFVRGVHVLSRCERCCFAPVGGVFWRPFSSQKYIPQGIGIGRDYSIIFKVILALLAGGWWCVSISILFIDMMS